MTARRFFSWRVFCSNAIFRVTEKNHRQSGISEHGVQRSVPETSWQSARKVLAFAAIAWLITWGTGLTVVLSTHCDLVHGAHRVAHPIPLALPLAIILILIGDYGPAMAALLVTAVQSGRPGVRSLLHTFFEWKGGWQWYAIALLGPSLLALVALMVGTLFAGNVPHRWFLSVRPLSLLGLLFGPWGEELGWRGYAQRGLQRRWGALPAAGIVGLMWFCWHYWPLATPAGHWGASTQDFGWLGFMIVESILMAWLYNSTGGSLPVAWAAHAGYNLQARLLDIHPWPFGWYYALFLLAAIVVALIYGPRTLSRSECP